MKQKLSRMLGFTMIELLVVIAVIGVLAVAVLSSINPIEQINKGRDTRTRSDAAQLINAVDRYYAIHETYPWNDMSGATITDAASAFSYSDGASGINEWATLLVETDEVKQGFVTRLANDDKISVFKTTGANQTMYACFFPQSKAFVQEAAKNCASGVTPTGSGVPFSLCVSGSEHICLP